MIMTSDQLAKELNKAIDWKQLAIDNREKEKEKEAKQKSKKELKK